MRVFLSNTARANQLEEFSPLHPPRVGLYTCGPTVYGPTHIGHIRTYVHTAPSTNTALRRGSWGWAGYAALLGRKATAGGHRTGAAGGGENRRGRAAGGGARPRGETARHYEEHFFQTMAQVDVRRA